MTAMFLHNIDALVTKDYLNSRFNEFETRMEANVDKRFADMESKLDRRFAAVDARFAQMDARFARVNVLLGVILVALAIPVLQTILVWTAP